MVIRAAVDYFPVAQNGCDPRATEITASSTEYVLCLVAGSFTVTDTLALQ